MRIDPTNQPLQSHMPTADDEIDLLQAVGALYRYWGWIAGSGALGLILAGVNLLNTKPVYQGEFQIVLSKESSKGGALAMLSENPALASIAGLGVASGNDSIATEVQILNSPSVLKPVFDAVKASKTEAAANSMRFRNWANSAVTVEEEKGTSVLNVEFRDTDKNLVLPITKMISQVYQGYSNRSRSRELKNVITYLKTQIAIIKLRLKRVVIAIDYGYDNGLSLLDGLPLAGNVSGAGVSNEGNSGGAKVSGSGRALKLPLNCPAKGNGPRNTD